MKLKMKKLLLSIISLIAINLCFGQKVELTGIIIDSNTHQPLPFATIELFSLKTGTIADKNGNFIIKITSSDIILDTINFSYLGYEKVKMSISDFLKSEKNIVLKEKIIELEEVKIIPRKYTTTILGIKDKKPRSMQYANVFNGKKGNFIENKKNEIGWIKSVSYYIHPDGHPTTPFRIRIYERNKNEKPGKDLLNENLVVSAKKSGWYTIDISDYNISFPKEGAFVMMEWINSGEEFYFEKDITIKGNDGQTETVKRKYYGQSLGVVSKKGGVVLWGTTLGNDWIPYDFNYRGRYPNAMINAEIIYEND